HRRQAPARRVGMRRRDGRHRRRFDRLQSFGLWPDPAAGLEPAGADADQRVPAAALARRAAAANRQGHRHGARSQTAPGRGGGRRHGSARRGHGRSDRSARGIDHPAVRSGTQSGRTHPARTIHAVNAPDSVASTVGTPVEKKTPPPPPLRKVALALAIGTSGGFVCYLLRMPLAWMMGAALATAFAAFMGAPMRMQPQLRQLMLIVLGVLLGSSFHPGLLAHLGEWTISLGILMLLTFCSAGAVFAFYRRVGRYDRTTAFFSSVPGGLGEMTTTGGLMGGDERIIAISHAVRIISVVLTIPLWFRLTGNISPTASTGIHLLDLVPVDIAALVALGAAGAFIGTTLKLPAALLVGSMIASAIAHLAG